MREREELSKFGPDLLRNRTFEKQVKIGFLVQLAEGASTRPMPRALSQGLPSQIFV